MTAVHDNATPVIVHLSIHEVSPKVCRDAIYHVHPISHVLCIWTVQIVALFEVLVSLSCIDTCCSEARLNGCAIQVRCCVYVSIQL